MKEFLDFTLVEWNNYRFTVLQLLTIILIVLGTRILTWVVKRAYMKRVTPVSEDAGRNYAVVQLIKYVLWLFAFILIMQTAGFKITLLLAGSAALLVGIGLGLQQTFNDFISGFILLLDRTIEINDVIEVDGMIARVQHIGLRTSTLVTRDDISVIVPNSTITGNNVINWSHTKKQSRFHLLIGVSYGSDEERVREVLLESAGIHDGILKEPAPFVRLEEFADSSVNFSIYFWTNDVFRVENLKSDLRFTIVKKLRENNITIPFPQMDLYIKENRAVQQNREGG